MKPELLQLDHFPDALLNLPAQDVHTVLPQPTLIHLDGRERSGVFVSVLLHGNETTGWAALQQLMRQYRKRGLPRALSIFVGNVEAARAGLRRLDGQPDYNRIWPGTELPPSAETWLAEQVVGIMAEREPFLSVDVHNNTGLNPHYACINRLSPDFLHLAALFGRLVVYFRYPKGVQSAAFAPLCPAVTLECGKPERPEGVEHAIRFLDSCLHLDHFPKAPLPSRDIDLYHTVAQVTIKPEIRFSYTDDAADLLLDGDLDHLNFAETPSGTRFGRVRHDDSMPILARDERGIERTHEFFALDADRWIKLKKTVMPSMLTLDETVIRQDCLCYLMERMSV